MEGQTSPFVKISGKDEMHAEGRLVCKEIGKLRRYREGIQFLLSLTDRANAQNVKKKTRISVCRRPTILNQNWKMKPSSLS